MPALKTEVTKQKWIDDETSFALPTRKWTPFRICMHLLFWAFDMFEAWVALDRVLRVDPKVPPNPELFKLMYPTHVVSTMILFYSYGYLVVPSLMKLLVYIGDTDMTSLRKRIKNISMWRKCAFVFLSTVAVFVIFNIYDYYLFPYATSHYTPAPAYLKRNNDVLLAVGPLGVLSGYTILSFLWGYNISYVMLPLLLRIIRESIAWGVGSVRQQKEIVKQQEEIVIQKEQNQTLIRNQLLFLQAQINPHFLFNVFNSLLALIQRTNQEAAGLLKRLSDLLHYTLYKTDKEFVPLLGELQFLKNYVEIEKMRHFNPERISFNQTGDAHGLLVPPLLLVTFIENAFKHGLHNSFDEEWVTIDLLITEQSQQLQINISNSLAVNDIPSDKPGGVGLVNARKRLDYLFDPSTYKLTILETKDEYSVSLTIPLKYSPSHEYQS